MSASSPDTLARPVAVSPSPRMAWSLKVQRYGLWLLVLVMLVLLWGSVITALSLQRQRLIEQSTQELALLNRAVAQQTAGLFKSIETSLLVTDHWLQEFTGVDAVNNPRFVELVEHLRGTSDGLFDIRIASAAGELRHVPNPTGRVQDQIADKDHFRVHQTRKGRALHIGLPELNTHSGRWELPVSWPLESPRAGAAVVMAAVDLELLSIAYEPVRVKPEGTVVLLRRDDRILSRAPFQRDILGRSLRTGATMENMMADRMRATFVSDSGSTDGKRRIASFERLEDYPLTILVSRGEGDVLQPYLERRNTVLAACLVLSVVVLLLTGVVDRAQRALQGAQRRMQRLAMVDDLTGIMNRRAFIDQARREFARVMRAHRPCSVLVLDLDHFKQINDSHGHLAGDQVLRECSAAWRAVLRQQDLIGRMGGEEFCLLLPELGAKDAEVVAQRLRRLTAELSFNQPGGAFHVTVSVGLVERGAGDTDWSQLYDRADKALYRAKAQGRDQVVVG